MKKIEITIKAVAEIPDHWEIVDPGDTIPAAKTDDGLNIFELSFLKERKEGFTSGDDDFFNDWLERLETEDCEIKEL